MTNDARLYGLPEAAAAMFKPLLKDIGTHPGVQTNLAVAHANVSNFATAGALLCEVMQTGNNQTKMNAALTMLDLTINRKAPTQIEHFQAAARVIDEACERGNPKAWEVRDQLSRVNFDVSFG